MSASHADLRALWQLVLDEFKDYLVRTPPSKRRASYISQIIKFLHHNGVKVTPQSLSNPRELKAQLDGLALPFTVVPGSDTEQ